MTPRFSPAWWYSQPSASASSRAAVPYVSWRPTTSTPDARMILSCFSRWWWTLVPPYQRFQLITRSSRGSDAPGRSDGSGRSEGPDRSEGPGRSEGSDASGASRVVIMSRSPAGVTSSRLSRTVRPGAAAIGASDGTASTAQPAASAEETPVRVSSTATQDAGSTPRARQAARYGSGAGLVRGVSSAVTVTAKRPAPRPSTTRSAMARGDAVTRAVGTPSAASASRSRSAPGLATTPERTRSANSRCRSAATSANGAPVARLSISAVCSTGRPSTSSSSASVSDLPSPAATCSTASHHSRSVSTRVPSMSNRTAWSGCWGRRCVSVAGVVWGMWGVTRLSLTGGRRPGRDAPAGSRSRRCPRPARWPRGSAGRPSPRCRRRAGR